MKLFTAFLAFGALLFTVSFTSAAEKVDLFNGKNLDGWYKFIRNRGKDADPNNVFSVQNGMIRVSGEEWGCITTEKSFENYKITVEFKWGEKTWGNRKDKARDSGLLIHSFGKDGGFGGIWMLSVEANIVEGGIGDFWIVGGKNDGVSGTCKCTVRPDGKIYDPVNGKPITITKNSEGFFGWTKRDPNFKDVLNFRGKNDLDRPDGWNTLSVAAKGDTMEVFHNGEKVNEIFGLKQTSGKIQLQSEGAEIFFRKITLEPLD
ncbi:MAG: DUF1080 domain-containing protein [Planctomycetia bacterium]|nr:DUF1080 domain-containing protein [Planctomycetia bacterium]